MNPIDPEIEQIAQIIKHHRKLETKQLTRPDKNLAVALSNVYYFGENKKIWITPKENLGGTHRQTDITGFTTAPISGGQTTLSGDGDVVYKNSKLAEVLIRNFSGKHLVPTPLGEKEIEIFNFTHYSPNPHHSEASDLVFNLQEDRSFKFNSLSIILDGISKLEEEIQSIEQDQKRLKEDDLEELLLITQRLEKTKKRQEELVREAQQFIRVSAQLRHQPILDPWQELIKRSNVFSGTMAIDGGPGTGKTTSLIQRIKFLTDRQAMLGISGTGKEEEGYLQNTSPARIEALFGRENNWAFFTPNELLKLFLKNSMSEEGLLVDDSKVLIWKDHLDVLMRQYRLVNPETQNPFLILRKDRDKELLPHDAEALNQIVTAFRTHFSGQIVNRLNRVSSIDVSRFKWKNIALSIQNYIKKDNKEYSPEDLIRLFFNLQETYEKEVKELTGEFSEILNKSAARLLKLLQSNPEFKTKTFAFAEEWKRNTNSTDETEEELEDEDLEDNSSDLETFLYGKFKVLIKNTALSSYDFSISISKKFREFAAIIKPYEDFESFEEFDRIGQLAYFSKYFALSVRGLAANMVVEIPRAYKSFRKAELDSKVHPWNFDLLHYLVEDEGSKKRIHPDEQAFLIYFINSFIKLSHKVSQPKSKEINHSYFQAFRQVSLPVIGVDEATDFHLIDLLAIHSLGHVEISSVTFSGDIMQRLTQRGIRSWDELERFIDFFYVMPLKISYRQSPTLLEVASSIYQKATGRSVQYKSFTERDPLEPKPLWFKSDQEDQKITWIAQRIQEIYFAYGSNTIPSIAIFLADEDHEIDKFTDKLNDTDELADHGIQVRASKDGKVLDSKNVVRVFPIEYIKGLEFEAVFFHNLQNLTERGQSPEMVMKNLYVGLSRATFYMGITSKVEGEQFEFLDNLFERKALTWNLKTLKYNQSTD
ncbi:MAG: hypothetical protein KGZ90_08830 [Algoriphagus sp.]|nr:hypothetical protein [Algoriphagus sp.]